MSYSVVIPECLECLAPNAYLLITDVIVKLRKISWFLVVPLLLSIARIYVYFFILFCLCPSEVCWILAFLSYSWKISSIEPFAQSHTSQGVRASVSQIHNFLFSALTTVEDFIFV